jgi:biotin carboxyl carrier protein
VQVPTNRQLEMSERVVVSPAAGAFTALVSDGADVHVNQVIGEVRTGTDIVHVATPFAGRLVAVVAWNGERVHAFQRLAWLRAA